MSGSRLEVAEGLRKRMWFLGSKSSVISSINDVKAILRQQGRKVTKKVNNASISTVVRTILVCHHHHHALCIYSQANT